MTSEQMHHPAQSAPAALTASSESTRSRRKPPVDASNRWLSKRIIVGLTVAVACGAVIIIAGARRDFNASSQELIYHTVVPVDVPIDVVERGNLESQQDLRIYCEVDDVSGDGIVGTPIVWILPNGTLVKEGELVVELDASGHKENLDEQVLDTEKARSTQLQAQSRYENQVIQNELLKADAELDVEIAQLELRMFEDEENGEHKLEVDQIRRQIDDINSEILAAEANLQLKEKEEKGIAKLFDLGYAGQSELDRSRLDYLQAESQYSAKINKLKTQLDTLKKAETYEREIQLLKLKGAMDTATRKLQQVEQNSEALLAQAQYVLDAANSSLEKEEERLERYKMQVEKCKIYAPMEGMVTYATSSSRYSSSTIREGEPVRPRQHILSLPNLKKMQVKTSVHESVLDKISEGLRTTVRVDAFPDRIYQGTVQSVAVLPDQGNYFSSDTKVYETIVLIDGEVDQLKPGMTAVVEIHVDRLDDVLAIPVQAVVEVGKQDWCYVDGGRQGPQRRDIELGQTNDKFVEVLSGLQEGDRVVLNPMALMTEADRKSAEESQQKAAEAESEAAYQQALESKPAKDQTDVGANAARDDKPKKQPDRAKGDDADIPNP